MIFGFSLVCRLVSVLASFVFHHFSIYYLSINAHLMDFSCCFSGWLCKSLERWWMLWDIAMVLLTVSECWKNWSMMMQNFNLAQWNLLLVYAVYLVHGEVTRVAEASVNSSLVNQHWCLWFTMPLLQWLINRMYDDCLSGSTIALIGSTFRTSEAVEVYEV